jgi:hypothetical protein
MGEGAVRWRELGKGGIIYGRRRMKITYRFKLDGAAEKRFDLDLEPSTLTLVGGASEPLPEWTRLGHMQCPNCPLAAAEHPRCPVAKNLVAIIDEFKDGISFHEADISILTESREYRRRAPLQQGISALIGLVMVTSGCPILDKLRPMAYTHTPFSSVPETLYRAVSMYLTAQYFMARKGKTPDWEMKDLVGIYKEVGAVNSAFADRLRTIQIEDASLNAVVNLDCFAFNAVFSITDRSLREMERIFDAYLKP